MVSRLLFCKVVVTKIKPIDVLLFLHQSKHKEKKLETNDAAKKVLVG
jgi:hypothetical protein